MKRSTTLTGIGVSPGIAYASAVIVRLDFPDVPDRGIQSSEVESEVERLHQAVAEATESLESLRARVLERAGEEESRIFDAQILMVQDSEFLAGVEILIRNNNLSAETAYEFKALEYRELFAGSAKAHLRERLIDITATQRRVLHRLTGWEENEWWSASLEDPVIIVARELPPGVTVQLDREHVVGLLSEEGTRTSHAAILAHSLGIPAVMGARGALDKIEDGVPILLDGHTGMVYVEPTRAELEDARARISRWHRLKMELETVASEPAVTPDGRTVTLRGNVDLPEEVEPALRYGAEGVGLLRTEFLVTGRANLPTEDEQTTYYRRVADAFRDHTVTIRAFDLGGDKFPAAFSAPAEANPFLGWRSIRVCLDQPEIFRPQLRAILRTAADRKVQFMLPLVTSVEEVVVSREMMLEEADSLRRAGVRAADDVPLGVMVETPAAVLVADHLAQVSDFFSVGTNDLTQYTLAVDRGNAMLSGRFVPHHPAVLRQLQQTVEVATRFDIPVSVCGEMASDPILGVLLIGLGYFDLSVAPPSIPLVKWVIRRVPYTVALAAADEALTAMTAEEVAEIVRNHVDPLVDLKLLDPAGALP
ncbi:MAG: phosphoenolpyruvate--protein phosphotransferase [Gemmatimonadales bacterium]